MKPEAPHPTRTAGAGEHRDSRQFRAQPKGAAENCRARPFHAGGASRFSVRPASTWCHARGWTRMRHARVPVRVLNQETWLFFTADTPPPTDHGPPAPQSVSEKQPKRLLLSLAVPSRHQMRRWRWALGARHGSRRMKPAFGADDTETRWGHGLRSVCTQVGERSSQDSPVGTRC